jgi:hypothetical protein
MESLRQLTRLVGQILRTLWQTWDRAISWQNPTHQEVSRILRMTKEDWLLQPELEDGKETKSGIREVVSLMTIQMTQVLALLVYVYVQKNAVPEWLVVVIYVGLSVLPLVGMLLILNLRSRACNSKRAFDRSTIMFTRWTFTLSFVLVGSMGVCCLYRLLPGQEVVPTTLKILKVEKSEFKSGNALSDDLKPDIGKGDAKIVISVALGPWDQNESSATNTVAIRFTLDPITAQSWRLVGATGTSFSHAKCQQPSIAPGPAYKKVITWPAMDWNQAYVLKLILHQIAERPGSQEEERITGRLVEHPEAAIAVTALYPK